MFLFNHVISFYYNSLHVIGERYLMNQSTQQKTKRKSYLKMKNDSYSVKDDEMKCDGCHLFLFDDNCA